MGMKKGITIEEAKEILKAYDFGFTGYAGSLKDAIDSVLPIVEKHQKIEQILYCHNRYTDDAAECIENLREVIEDGYDN